MPPPPAQRTLCSSLRHGLGQGLGHALGLPGGTGLGLGGGDGSGQAAGGARLRSGLSGCSSGEGAESSLQSSS